MARKPAEYTVTDEGRDKGKRYLITEMSAADGEWWAMRALMALMKSGVNVPEDDETLGMPGLAQIGLKSLSALNPETLKPLLDEMFQCIQIKTDPKHPEFSRPIIADTDIEEIKTRLMLRAEWGKLHFDFFLSAAPSLLDQAREAASNSKATRISRK